MPRAPKKTGKTPTATLKPTRRTTTKQEAAKPEAAVSELEISRLAYEIYEQRGRTDGAQLDDWLQAEQQLRSGAER
jgi:DUF2934 family protein